MSYQRDKIRKLNQELDQFVYSCYHDLRAPVATILGLINLIKSSDVKDFDNYVNLIHESILKLDLRIKDIIDYSKNSRLRLERQQISIADLVNILLERNKNYLNQKSITTHINIEEHTKFYSDKIRTNIILENLISNAINFQKPDSTEGIIDISGSVTMEKAVIRVKDNGIGITQKSLDQAYDMFFKASNSSTGAGLGLYIVKESLNKLNGDINIQSNASKGTLVEVTIPNIL